MTLPVLVGKVTHAQLNIGEAVVFLADEFPEVDVLSPQSLGGTPVMIHLLVDHVYRTWPRGDAQS